MIIAHEIMLLCRDGVQALSSHHKKIKGNTCTPERNIQILTSV